ncbi:protease pro-enzyme activation domain-containing protein [Sulfurisphaera javensis]|uniref:Protease pro-enzyme activation domain-containing protein n=1 Tax=Sulfurisphaera javensis TaxID=2049879 RepID=A0AAT9GUF0_9CREN
MNRNTSLIVIFLILLIAEVSSQSIVSLSYSQPYYLVYNSPFYSLIYQSEYVGPLNGSQVIYFAVVLNFTNFSSLMQTTNEILNHVMGFMSPQQFREYYYPSTSYINSVISYMKSYGISFIGQYGLLLIFKGTVNEVENAFNTYINLYFYPTGEIFWFGEPGLLTFVPFYFYANNVTPSLPYNIGKHIIGIIGLNSIDPTIYPSLYNSNFQLASNPLISNVTVTPSIIAQYFNFTKVYEENKLGQGMSIGIIGEPESYVNSSDIYHFWNKFSIVPREGKLNVIVFGSNTSEGESAENEMDAEWAGVLAPDANIYIVFSDGYVGGNKMIGNLLNYYYEFYYMINYINPDVLSVSVELPESFLAAYDPVMLYAINNLLIQAADQGISVIAAAGDWGYESNFPPIDFMINVQNTIWFPASDPLVTSAGGIFVNVSSTGKVLNISGWDYSTGGFSVVFYGQSYEMNSLIPGTLTLFRKYPDIAFVADGGYNITEYGSGLPMIYNGSTYYWFGTSGAAPMTAAMVVLSGHRLGSLNYIFYYISYSGEIDINGYEMQGLPPWIPITSGYNPMPATYGWNYVTGIGTYNAYAMVYDLDLIYSVVYG